MNDIVTPPPINDLAVVVLELRIPPDEDPLIWIGRVAEAISAVVQTKSLESHVDRLWVGIAQTAEAVKAHHPEDGHVP
jgi:hypothetical protein